MPSYYCQITGLPAPEKWRQVYRLFFKLDAADPNQNSQKHYPRIVHVQRVAA
jgi:hypothetical protein